MGDKNAKNVGHATRFKPGVSGNPGGSTQGHRRKLQGDFLAKLTADFDLHGKKAIVQCRENEPAQYLKIVASLMPKEVEIKRPLEELSDDELTRAVAALQSFVSAQGIAGGTTDPAGPKQAGDVSSLH